MVLPPPETSKPHSTRKQQQSHRVTNQMRKNIGISKVYSKSGKIRKLQRGNQQTKTSTSLKPGSFKEKIKSWHLRAVPRILCSDEVIQEWHEIVNTVIPEGEILSCQIEAVYSFDSAKPFYVLTMPFEVEHKENSDTENEFDTSVSSEKRIAILTARKTSSTFSSSFCFSLEPEDFSITKESKLSKWFAGRMESQNNMFAKRKQFVLFSAGCSPRCKNDQCLESAKTKTTNHAWPVKERKHTMSIMLRLRSTLVLPYLRTTMLKSSFYEGKTVKEDHLLIFDTLNENNEQSLNRKLKRVEKFLKDHQYEFLVQKNLEGLKRPTIARFAKYPIAPSVKNMELTRFERKTLKKSNSNLSLETKCGLARIGSKRYFVVVRKPLTMYEAFACAVARLEAQRSWQSSILKTSLLH